MKILFFSPFSAFSEHALVELRLANSLRDLGNEITFITCGEVLNSHCTVMSASGLSPIASAQERRKTCSGCSRNAHLYTKIFALNSISLSDLLSEEDYSEVQELLNKSNKSDKLDLISHGVNIGRRTLYPFLAYKKRDSLKFSDADRHEYLDQLKQSVLVASCANKIIDKYKPDIVLTYSATYSVLSVFLEVARLNGVATYFIEATSNLSRRHDRIIVGRDGIGEWYQSLRDLWFAQSINFASAEGIKSTAQHLCHLIRADSVFTYSPPTNSEAKSIREIFNIPVGSKVLLATMSSYDEVFSAQEAGILNKGGVIFNTQIEWIEWLIRFISKRRDLFLIIRVHPREFPTRRELGKGVKSTHASKLEKLFVDLPNNCVVNWPSQNISLYDLAKDACVVLNAWSSAGKEMSLLGLPVVEWADAWLLYPPQTQYAAVNEEDYENKICTALEAGWSKQALLYMFRWCSLEFSQASINHKQVARNSEFNVKCLLLFIRRIMRRMLPFSYDVRISKYQQIPLPEVKKIHSLFISGGPTLAHTSIQSEAGSDGERMAIVQALDMIIESLFPHGNEGSKLYHNLVTFRDNND